MKQPLIKWTGSKRSIAKDIISYFPKKVKTYYEPFLGGGSVFFQLLKSDISIDKYVLSDVNDDLIRIYSLLLSNPKYLIETYREHWTNLQRNSDYYYQIRDEYNLTKSETMFYFLTRTCYNGTIRYNAKGEFNTSLHFSRPGMNPDEVAKIILYYENLMKDKDITFENLSFENINPKSETDVMYLDPPYTNSKALYFGNIDFKTFEAWLENKKCFWFLNINGISSKDNDSKIKVKYDKKVLLTSGKSSFSRMKKKNINVKEYFYIKRPIKR